MAGTENTKASELLHTPGGVRDIYGSACARKLEVQHSLEQVMHSYGFRNVQTPTFEYFDIFLGRMMMCRGAAEILNMKFRLTANGSKVL